MPNSLPEFVISCRKYISYFPIHLNPNNIDIIILSNAYPICPLTPNPILERLSLSNKDVNILPEGKEIRLDTAYYRANWYDEFVHIPSQVDFLKGKYNDNINKIPYIDYIGKLENLQESWKVISERLGIEYEPLPHENKSKNKNFFSNYRDAYNKKTEEYVREKYNEDIKLFNYEF